MQHHQGKKFFVPIRTFVCTYVCVVSLSRRKFPFRFTRDTNLHGRGIRAMRAVAEQRQQALLNCYRLRRRFSRKKQALRLERPVAADHQRIRLAFLVVSTNELEAALSLPLPVKWALAASAAASAEDARPRRLDGGRRSLSLSLLSAREQASGGGGGCARCQRESLCLNSA